MYILLMLVLLAAAVSLVVTGGIKGRTGRVVVGIALAVATVLFFGLLSLWGEALWFASVGFAQRFWTEIGARVVIAVLGAVAAAAVLAVVSRPTRARAGRTYFGAVLAAAASGAVWGFGVWDTVLLFLNRVSTGTTDPILGLDSGFYLFTLPLLDQLYGLGLWLAIIAVAAVAVTSLAPQGGDEIDVRYGPLLASLPRAVAWLAAVLAFGRLLGVAHLLQSDWGVVAGPGWTDVHIRLPALIVMVVVLLAAGLAALIPAVRRQLARLVRRSGERSRAELTGATVLWAGAVAVWIVVLGVIPVLFQWLIVEPNEITYETPYIAHNIEFTRRGFGLNSLEERQFPAKESFTRQTAEANRRLLEEVRLWDWRALAAVYTQFQEIRLYYEFTDVDIDRYRVGGRYRQVMVSAREMEQANLPAQSQTFVNRRFKYTHGYGLTMAPVSEFTSEGLPQLLVQDIPPVATVPELEVRRPELYYGELTTQPVVANSSEEEFDRPSGEENVYVRYAGDGGVQLANLWRKFVFGWMFDGTRFFLSSYPQAESRVMFHREIRDRVTTIAPFLTLDQDPYVVLIDGELHWIVDAYTTSASYPYSEPYASVERIEQSNGEMRQSLSRRTVPALDGANWVRNSVKVVVNAYDGDVRLFVVEPDDPMIQAWQGVFPELLTSGEAMSDALRAHIRYPADYLLVQGLVYAKYHMTDPEVFYNQEDLWVRATEKYYGQVQPVEPYYVMWHPEGTEDVEFVLILPFTPKNRQVLIGWIAGMCDPGSYGRFLAYKFPKERRVIGPQQVETKIDQDAYLSGQLTLWDQRGSRVIRGNVLAIPIAQTVLYVEPIYLQAETAAYPELRLVVLMHGDNMAYAESFDEALAGLFGDQPATRPATVAGMTQAPRSLAQQANEAFTRYLELQGRGQLEEAGRELGRLRDLLQQMAGAEQQSDE